MWTAPKIEIYRVCACVPACVCGWERIIYQNNLYVQLRPNKLQPSRPEKKVGESVFIIIIIIVISFE